MSYWVCEKCGAKFPEPKIKKEIWVCPRDGSHKIKKIVDEPISPEKEQWYCVKCKKYFDTPDRCPCCNGLTLSNLPFKKLQ